MRLHFTDQTFSFQLLRAASYAPYGGAELGECLATAGRIRDFESWHLEWRRTADRVEALAVRALEAAHRISAREALMRASNYHRTAEFFLAPDDPRRLPTYERSRETFRNALALLDTPVEHVRIPHEGTTLPAHFYRVDDSDAPRPTILSLGGFDSTGEELYFLTAAAALRRGYNCLALQGPGQGEPLRLQGMPARPDYEVPVRAAVDHALRRPEVDAARLAIWGSSLGGYYASRAAAFEPRLKACVVHGAVHDLWDVQASKQPLLIMLAKYWPGLLRQAWLLDALGRFDAELRWSAANGRWVFDAGDPVELLATLRGYSLKGVAERIACPTLVLHGEGDHLIPVEQAVELHAALTCPKTLRIFTADEGAEEHCQLGNLGQLHQVAFDWLDGVFAGDDSSIISMSPAPSL